MKICPHIFLVALFLLPSRLALAQAAEAPSQTTGFRTALDPELLPPITPEYARRRGLEVEALQRELKMRIRPKRYGLKLGLSIGALGAGALAIFIGAMNMPIHGPGDPRVPGAVMAAGGGAALLGGLGLVYVRLRLRARARPHRATFRRLREERLFWDREYRESLDGAAETRIRTMRASVAINPAGLQFDLRF